jgi:type II restriction enzyme
MVEERRSAIKPAREYARPTNEFANEDVYGFARELERLHPGNRHIKDKIRQQLQVLRDRHLLVHVDRNCWRLP